MSAEEDLRRLIDEPAQEGSDYSSARLAEILAAHGGNSLKAAAQIWTEKAAAYATLVDMKEGDTSRNLSGLQANALRMAKLYSDQASGGETGGHTTTIGRITRA